MANVKPYVPPALDLISDNIAKSGNALGLSAKDCSSWASNLQLPDKGDTILYTGCEYQMTAYIQPLRDVLKKIKFQDGLFSVFQKVQGLAKNINIDLTRTYTQLSGSQQKIYDDILQMAALTLRKLNIDFAYLKDELYTGALLYELGLFENFQKQAHQVSDQFKQAGVKTIITMSPHSAEAFHQTYPEFVNNFNFSVTTYVQVIAEALRKYEKELELKEPLIVTLHDPCHFTRSLDVTEEPRQVLKSIKNLEFREVESNRTATVCCGAPCELVYPELAEIAAVRRVKQLAETGAEAVITLCPFCHANLSAGVNMANIKLKVIDFIEIVYHALEGNNARS